MVAALDKNKYDENDLVQIKLPLNIPYTVDRRGYEKMRWADCVKWCSL